jgi:hypothetical protein
MTPLKPAYEVIYAYKVEDYEDDYFVADRAMI